MDGSPWVVLPTYNEAAVLVPRPRFGRRWVLRAPAVAVAAPSGSGEPDQLPIH